MAPSIKTRNFHRSVSILGADGVGNSLFSVGDFFVYLKIFVVGMFEFLNQQPLFVMHIMNRPRDKLSY